ncbi:shikimate kinase [Candidatus Contubernalis alkaliaceticus]|uniref:shikimate kinase n=1 Tax=Candidatus Contubernalis alkaliaceticus TaxID=338645 RepID=UPI001F4C05FB|nr:shikimate kinase [Candidatus Contubernalis alkalaceticus]UNC91785.1 shikimate kinase [Candidatus Contubernalis alkalaceticus]
MKNIVLIGMPGAGKSTLGVLLAKALGRPFVDTDLLIQKREGKLLQSIIDQKGIQYFLTIEEEVILELEINNYVVATGGSVVYSQKAVNWLKKYGVVLYLSLPFEEIRKRVQNIKTRGVAMEKGQSLEALFMKRVPLYEQYADITIDCVGLTMEQVVELMVTEFN